MNMKLSGITALLLCLLSGNAAEPLLRAGIMTDTHINEKESSFHLVKPALELFKAHKTDVVIHMGDFADVHCPGGYRMYRKIFNRIFPENAPKEIIVYDGHDASGHPNREQAFKAMQKNLGKINDPYDKIIINGYTFLVYPFKADLKRQEKEMTEAVNTSNGRPVFVLDHHPPFATTATSRQWGSITRRRLADKFPQVVRITGHSHGSLRNERNIWQGKFTTVNAGCLYNWPGMLIGNSAENKTPDEVMIMEVYQDKILFRCFSVRDRQEIRAGNPWSVPWPFDEKTAPYSAENRLKTFPAAEFPANSKIKLLPQKGKVSSILFTFPEAEEVKNCYIYKTELFQGTKRITRKDYHSTFWKTHPGKEVSGSWSGGFLEEGKRYRFTVTPINFAGREGKSLESSFTASALEKGEIRFECKDPLLPGCKVMTGTFGGKPLKMHRNFFRHPGGEARIEFPPEAWKGNAGDRFRLVIDLETIQQKDWQWTLRLRNTRPAWPANYRMWTLPGKPGSVRYVIDFEKKSSAGTLNLQITESSWGQFRVNYMRIERFLSQKNGN